MFVSIENLNNEDMKCSAFIRSDRFNMLECIEKVGRSRKNCSTALKPKIISYFTKTEFKIENSHLFGETLKKQKIMLITFEISGVSGTRYFEVSHLNPFSVLTVIAEKNLTNNFDFKKISEQYLNLTLNQTGNDFATLKFENFQASSMIDKFNFIYLNFFFKAIFWVIFKLKKII